VAGGGGHLLERTHELQLIDGSLRAAQASRGSLTFVEGPPGIGKTELLAAGISCARQRRMAVLSARGGELEMSFPYAVVRQLFEPALMRADSAIRHRMLSGAATHAGRIVDPRADPGLAPVEPSSAMHGLYWLTANLAADQALLLVIDDVHWCDPASLSWFVYLARRIGDLQVALILGARPAEPGAEDALLERLRRAEGLTHIQPAPLSLAGVDGLARAILGDQVERAFTDACHTVTGGTPFYATELLRALRHDRVEGTAGDVGAIEGLTPRAVVDATLARLGRLPVEARSVAEGVALLEPTADLRWIAALTGLDVDAVAGAADSLLQLGLLRSVAPCHFAHPILRSAVQSEIPPARRGRLHHGAAWLLAEAEMPVDAVAAHLMQTPPLGKPWIVSALARAARYASARGAPAGAVAYLQRALAERPAASERRGLLLDLGKAESQIHAPQAPGHLREALALAEHPGEVATMALWLGQALYHSGALDEAFDVMSDVLQRSGGRDSDATLELEAYMLSLAGAAGKMTETAERAASLESRTPVDARAAGAVQATLAFRDVLTGGPRERVRARAERAAEDIMRNRAPSSHLSDRQAPGASLTWIDELDRATELFTELLDDAARMGRLQTFEIFSALRGYTALRRGDLANAAADIEPILTAAPHGETPSFAVLFAMITQVQLLIEEGRPDIAEEKARSAQVPVGFERGFVAALVRHGEGAALLAQHKFAEAALALTEVGKLCDANSLRSPVAFPWRSDLALALAGTDRHGEAIELASTELRLADGCDVDRARGHALRTLGLLRGGEPGLRDLRAAVQAFARSPARVERGWAQYELGAALRRANRRREARPPLDLGLDLALACGAGLLAGRCRAELKALGARPRSVMLTGAESLTASERRVCLLAADGLKNADIAQALFVSLRTVETHLGNSYRKLDISSRAELSQALAATPR
jgi:DNA-binding CsgD family transcriptional regulator